LLGEDVELTFAPAGMLLVTTAIICDLLKFTNPPGKVHGLGRIGDDGIRTGDNSKNLHLAVECKQRRLFRIKFHVAFVY